MKTSEMVVSGFQESSSILNNVNSGIVTANSEREGPISCVCEDAGETVVGLTKFQSNGNQNLQKFKPNRKTGFRQFLGLTLAFLACLLMSLAFLLVKVLKAYHPFSLGFWRQWGNIGPPLFMIIYYRFWRKQNIFEHVWPINKDNANTLIVLTMCAFLGSNCVILRYYGMDFMTLADSTVVCYSGPIFIIIMAHFFLKEKCGIIALLIGVWTLFGVVVISRPPILTGKDVDINILIGTGITLMFVICECLMVILIRKIRHLHFTLLMLALGIWGLAQSFIVAKSFGVLTAPQGYIDIILTAGLAIFSYLGQMLGIFALKFEEAGPVSLIRTSDVLFSFIWQIIFLDLIPDEFSILGAIIVMVGVILTAIRKWISTLPEENSKRKTFNILLK